MARYVVWAGIAGLLLTGGFGAASPVAKGPLAEEQTIGPFDTYFFPALPFRGGERARAHASGDYHSFLGLYVYDVNGNCVAWDDEGSPSARDDDAIDWIPGTTAEYTVEVRNLGVYPNKVHLKVR